MTELNKESGNPESAEPTDVIPNTSSEANPGSVSEAEKALQARIDEVNAELAKVKQQKKEAVKEATDLRNKVKPADGNEDFKTLYETANQKAAKALEKVKNSDIRIALVNQLTKVGVRPDAIEAAIALSNQDRISWDENEGLDQTEVEHEVQVLKVKHKFLFEKPLSGKDGANPVNGQADKKTLRRIEFDKLSLPDRSAKMKEGYKVID